MKHVPEAGSRENRNAALEESSKSWAIDLRKPRKAWIVVATVALAFFVTNPTQDEYVSWLKQQIIKTDAGAHDALGNAMVSLFGGPLFNLSTTREDFLLFSIYTTDLGNGAKIKALGILRHFVPMEGTPEPNTTARSGNPATDIPPGGWRGERVPRR